MIDALIHTYRHRRRQIHTYTHPSRSGIQAARLHSSYIFECAERRQWRADQSILKIINALQASAMISGHRWSRDIGRWVLSGNHLLGEVFDFAGVQIVV